MFIGPHLLALLCIFVLSTSVFSENKIKDGSPQEVLVDGPDEMFQLADLLEGVSVDCSEVCSEAPSPGMNN